MSEEEELSRVYTINLSKVWLSPENRRTKRAINMIKEFATRHMKAEEIKIDEELNRQMWKRGIRHPPRRVRVKMVKDEDDIVTVSPYSEEAKEEIVEGKPEAEAAAPAAAATTAAQETVTEVAAEKQEVKVPEVEQIEEKVEKVAEVEEKEKPKKEEEPEKIVLSEEDLADIMAEEEGAGEEKKEPEKEKRKK